MIVLNIFSCSSNYREELYTPEIELVSKNLVLRKLEHELGVALQQSKSNRSEGDMVTMVDRMSFDYILD